MLGLVKAISDNCDLARLRLLQKTHLVDFTLGSPDWTVHVVPARIMHIACTVHVVPARIMHVQYMLYRLGSCIYSTCCTGSDNATLRIGCDVIRVSNTSDFTCAQLRAILFPRNSVQNVNTCAQFRTVPNNSEQFRAPEIRLETLVLISWFDINTGS